MTAQNLRRTCAMMEDSLAVPDVAMPPVLSQRLICPIRSVRLPILYAPRESIPVPVARHNRHR